MKVTEHDEFLVMITKLGFVNCFLVVEDDGVTLVDALAHGSGQGILEAVSQTGRPLKRVLMTHAHSDHIGSLDEVIAASDQVDFLVIVRCDSAHPHHRVANVPDGPTWNDTTLGRVPRRSHLIVTKSSHAVLPE